MYMNVVFCILSFCNFIVRHFVSYFFILHYFAMFDCFHLISFLGVSFFYFFSSFLNLFYDVIMYDYMYHTLPSLTWL